MEVSSPKRSPNRERRNQSRSYSPKNYRNRTPENSSHAENRHSQKRQNEKSYSRSPTKMYYRETSQSITNLKSNCKTNSNERQSESPKQVHKSQKQGSQSPLHSSDKKRRQESPPSKRRSQHRGNFQIEDRSSSRQHSRERDHRHSERQGKKSAERLKSSLISYKTNSQVLRQKFGTFGEIRDIYIPRNYYSRRPMGYGFIEFYKERDAKNAFREMNGRSIDGSYIQIQYAKEGRKSPGDMKYKEKSRGSKNRERSRSPRHRSRSDSQEKSSKRENSSRPSYNRSPKHSDGRRHQASISSSRSPIENKRKNYKRSPNKNDKPSNSSKRSSSVSYSPQ